MGEHLRGKEHVRFLKRLAEELSKPAPVVVGGHPL